LPGSIHGKIAQQRSQQMREVFDKAARKFAMHHIGSEQSVLWESAKKQADGKWLLHGLSDNYLEINGLAESDRCNKIDRVKIQSITGGLLTGEILNKVER
jgi:tRNA A37 methylthiotransferase MiaB